MADKKNPRQRNYPAKEVSGRGPDLDLYINMLSSVSDQLEPGRDINQYTLEALLACYKNSGIVFRGLKEVSGDEDIKNISNDLANAMVDLETAIQLKKEHEGLIPMADDKKSKGEIFHECVHYRKECYSKLEPVIENLRNAENK